MVNKMDEITDIINAFAVYKANEAGAFGKIHLEPRITGILGAMLKDVQDNAQSYIAGETTKEEATKNTKFSFLNGFGVAIEFLLSQGLEISANFISTSLPVFSGIINSGKEYIKTKVIPLAIKKGIYFIEEKIRQFM